MRAASVVAETVEGRVPIILHVGAPDTGTTIRLARHGRDIGVAAVGAVTPYYYRHREREVETYYRSLIEVAGVPVLAYNNPKYSNFSINPTLLATLARAGLAGVKDSSGDISLFYDYLAAVEETDFTFLIGSQTLLLPAMLMGAHGCVSGLSNVFPELLGEMLNAWREGDLASATALQRKANALRKLTGDGIPVPFYHAVLPMFGIDIGQPRPPFQPLEADSVQTIRSRLEAAGMFELAAPQA